MKSNYTQNTILMRERESKKWENLSIDL